MTDAELAEARLSALLDAERENTELHAKLAYFRGERAAVVAWLREQAESTSFRPRTCPRADAIERGEHRREEEP